MSPWASQDLEGLVTHLPDIHKGAGKWIKVFEEETVGKLFAVGDIKALLAKIMGGAKMEEILQASNLNRAVDSHYMDGTVFDAYRPAVWQALRAEYPIRLDPKSLKGEQLLDIENPITYVQRQLKRWKQETEGNPEGDPLMATLFRNAVIDAMPQAVKQSPQIHHPIPVPIINVYTQQPEPMGWKRQPVQRGQRGRGKPYTGPPGMC